MSLSGLMRVEVVPFFAGSQEVPFTERTIRASEPFGSCHRTGAVRASLLWDLVCTSCKSKSQSTHAASLPHAVHVLTWRNAGTKLKKKAEYPSEPGGKCDEMIGWWWLARVKVTLYPPSVIRTGLDGGSGGAPAAARSSVLMMAAPLLSVVDGEPDARTAVEPASSSTGSSILLGAAGQRRSRGGGTASADGGSPIAGQMRHSRVVAAHREWPMRSS